MKKVITTTTALILILSLAMPLSADNTGYDADMTIRQIAHDVGLKGRELAEEPGLEGSVDKDTALSQLGVLQQQLDAVLADLPSPVATEEKEHPTVSIEMTLQEAAHAMGIKGQKLAGGLLLLCQVPAYVRTGCVEL